MKIDGVKHIYFLGIGGIGMSALARYFLRAGKTISGYDKTSTVLTKTLESEGMDIHYDENVSLIPDSIDMVIYTPAVPKDNAEYTHIRESKMPIYRRSEVLGLISKKRKTIAVAGTHGKTTTCSIISYLLKNSGIDISAFVGGIMKNFDSNYLFGDSDWVVAEADEYDRSFLRLFPDIAVILSMDADHLDIYGDKNSVHQGFRDFTLNIKEGGSLWIHTAIRQNIDEKWKQALMNKGVSIHTFGIDDGDMQAKNVRVENGRFHYSIKVDKEIKGFSLGLAGRHNVSNAVVASAVSKELGCTWEDLKRSIESFEGIKRRFEIVAETDGKVLIDDYAHHPTELNAAIQATRELYPYKKVTVVFQPHLYTRTRDFVDGFAEELSKVDTLILTEIYPARELPIEGVTSEMIYNKIILNNKKLIHQSELIETLENMPFEILLITGAGDIDKKVKEIKEKYFNA